MTTEFMKSFGLSEDDALLLFNNFLDAELRGKSSHGLIRFCNTLRKFGKFNNNSLSITSDSISSTTIKVDGKGMLGIIPIMRACNQLVNMKSNNISMAAVTNYMGTTGALGYYARYLAKNNLISIILGNAKSSVAPVEGNAPVIGTNPLAIGLPREKEPIIVDFATSAISYGSILLAQNENCKLPDNSIRKYDGAPSNNPFDISAGYQLPMAGHKGFALGIAIEVMAGLFIGSKSGNLISGSEGTLIITIKQDSYISEKTYKEKVRIFSDEVHSIETLNEGDRVRLPGERLITSINDDEIYIKDYLYENFYEICKNFI